MGHAMEQARSAVHPFQAIRPPNVRSRKKGRSQIERRASGKMMMGHTPTQMKQLMLRCLTVTERIQTIVHLVWLNGQNNIKLIPPD
jgi:hypothetical protein